MIRYALKCDNAHEFESWFQSAEAFETLRTAGHAACPVCGSSDVSKAVMAPRVRPARTQAKPPAPSLKKPETPAEKAIADLRRKVEENSTYVGNDFAREARAMHEGEAPERSIHGEARPDEAKKLVEDGVPVLPLPFMNKSKTN